MLPLSLWFLCKLPIFSEFNKLFSVFAFNKPLCIANQSTTSQIKK